MIGRSASVGAAAGLLLLAGCSMPGGGDNETASSATSSAAASSATATPTPPPVPKVGQCYQLDYAEAAKAVSTSRPVDCRQPHTAVTAYVGTIDPYQDGHLLTVDSTRVQQRIAAACPRQVDRWLGGSEDDRRLSQTRAIWFSPSLEESDAGASWFRCDVIALAAPNRLTDLTGVRRNVLSSEEGRSRLGICGTAAPSTANAQRVVCSATHSWRAVSTVEIDRGSTYLGKAAQDAADAVCKGKAQDAASDPLNYTWSFEWPSAEDWKRGQRYGLCWLPDKS